MRPSQVDPDLVEYMLIGVPDLAGVDEVADALGRLVQADRIRILDIVAVIPNADGSCLTVEPEAVAGLTQLRDVDGEFGGLLSHNDVAMASAELPTGSAAVLLVAEDRWAGNLSRAARMVGGRIMGGERIPRHRWENVVLEEGSSDEAGC